MPRPSLLLLLSVFGCHGSDDDGGPTGPTTGPTTDASTTPTPTPTATGDTGTVTAPDVLDLAVDPSMVLMLHATFDDLDATEAWVEYRFEGDEWLVAPTIAPGEAVILGVPELTEVEARAARVVGGVTVLSDVATATTGALPPSILRPSVTSYDPLLASGEPYAMTSVSTGNFMFQGPYVIEIYDRAGRIVWYHVVPDELFSLYASPSRDGTHVWYDASDIFGLAGGATHVSRQTLDGRWRVDLPTPNAGQAYAEGPDDTFLYELRSSSHGVVQVDPTGATTLVWDCDAHMASIGRSGGDCLLNTCNWDESRNTILASQFMTSTVFEVDFATGQAVRQFGQLTQGAPYSIDPPSAMFAYQHFPYWTPEGTLFLSTHQPCGGQPGCADNEGREGIQVAAEYAVDDASRTLSLVWSHVSTDRWATQAGEAWRLPNGNVVLGYGQDGAVREVTASGATAWDLAWPSRDFTGYRAIGHTALIADLYALNEGW